MDLSPTASKLDTSLIWFAALAEQASLGLFQRFGIQAILERNAALSRRLLDALGARGTKLRPFPEQHRSTIVSVPVEDAEAAMARLRAAGVVASMRAGTDPVGGTLLQSRRRYRSGSRALLAEAMSVAPAPRPSFSEWWESV